MFFFLLCGLVESWVSLPSPCEGLLFLGGGCGVFTKGDCTRKSRMAEILHEDTTWVPYQGRYHTMGAGVGLANELQTKLPASNSTGQGFLKKKSAYAFKKQTTRMLNLGWTLVLGGWHEKLSLYIDLDCAGRIFTSKSISGLLDKPEQNFVPPFCTLITISHPKLQITFFKLSLSQYRACVDGTNAVQNPHLSYPVSPILHIKSPNTVLMIRPI